MFPRMNQWLQIYRLKNLSRREKWAVEFGILCCIIFFVMQWLILPIMDRRQRLNELALDKERALTEMYRLQQIIIASRNRGSAFNAKFKERPSDFNLFAFLETASREADIKNQVAYMKPATVPGTDSSVQLSVVEMQLQDISMANLVHFLFLVETSSNQITVERLSITRPSEQKQAISATLRVETLLT